MKFKILPPLIFPLFFLSCLSAPGEAPAASLAKEMESVQDIRSIEQLPPWVYDSSPVDGRPRIVVFTDKMSDKENALILASQMAALDAAKMDGIYVSAKTLAQEGDYNFGYAADVSIDYLKEKAPAYISQLELDKILHTEMGSVARFIYNGKSTPFSYESPVSYEEISQWIRKQPDIEGYTLAIGSADKHRSWSNSFAAADESAVANLTVTLFGKLKGIKDMKEYSRNDNNQLSQLETIFLSGEGILRDTMIIARWADKNEKQFYSMAVIPTPQGFK